MLPRYVMLWRNANNKQITSRLTPKSCKRIPTNDSCCDKQRGVRRERSLTEGQTSLFKDE